MRKKDSFHILLVEDDEGDVELVQEACSSLKLKMTMHVSTTGDTALDYLSQQAAQGNGALPDLVLLDLNLPRMDGREVLSAVRSDPGLKEIPVVIFTTSDAPIDIQKVYELGANCYVVKPSGLKEVIKTLHSIFNFWFHVTGQLNSNGENQ